MEKPFGNNHVKPRELQEETNFREAEKHLSRLGKSDSRELLKEYFDIISGSMALLDSKGKHHPWRTTNSVYRVFISEVLLQRTRGESVRQIYDDFFEEFPSPEKLYRADERNLRRRINSLGFGNKRTKTIQSAAKMLEKNDFKVPEDREKLMQPWRVGPYVANATLLFGFDKSVELIDTNTVETVGNLLDYPLPRVPHKNEDFRNFMRLLTPKSSDIARPYYLAMIDFNLEKEMKKE